MLSSLFFPAHRRISIENRYHLGASAVAFSGNYTRELRETNKNVAFAVIVRDLLQKETKTEIKKLSRRSIQMLDDVYVVFFGQPDEYLQRLRKANNQRREFLNKTWKHAKQIDREYHELVLEREKRSEQQEQAMRNWNPVELPPGGLVEWLQDKNGDVWHEVATNFNWDQSLEPLHWIACQPDCDIATAMSIFQAGAPDYFDDVDKLDELPEYQQLQVALLDMIAEKICQGFYSRQEIRCDLSEWGEYGDGLYRSWKLPKSAYGPFAGREHVSPFSFDGWEVWPPRPDY